MKVLHISTAKTWRGGEQQITYLINGLKSLNVESHIACPSEAPLKARCLENGFHVCELDMQEPQKLNWALRINTYCKKFKPDIIHAHDSHAHTTALLAIRLFRLNTPLVIHRRVNFNKRRIFLDELKYNHPNIKAFICVSEMIAKSLYKKVKNRQLIHAVYSTIDLNRFHPENRTKGDHWIIANLSAISPHKDYGTFIKTAERVLAKNKNVEFWIIGKDAGDKKNIELLIERKNLGEHIKLMGFRENIPELLSKIDILLFPSSEEGLGSLLLETMASGVALVTTNAGGIPELVKHGYNGLMAEIRDDETLANHIISLLEDPELMSSMINNGLTFVKDFDFREMSFKTKQIYLDILQTKKAP